MHGDLLILAAAASSILLVFLGIELLAPAVSRPKRKLCCCLLIPVRAGMEHLEQLLRWGINSVEWDRWLQAGRLILVDLQADEESRAICGAFCEEHDGVLFVKPEELSAALGGDDICKTLRCVLY